MNIINQTAMTTIRRLFITAALAAVMLAAFPVLVPNAGQAFAQAPQAGEPVQVGAYVTIPSLQEQRVADLYTVPANKRLVVEFYSASFVLPKEQRRSTFLRLTWGASSPSNLFNIALERNPATFGFSEPPGVDVYIANRLVRFYVNALMSGHIL